MIGIDLRANFYKLCTYGLLILAVAAAGSSLYYRNKARLAVASAETAQAKLAKAEYVATQVIEFNRGFQQTTDVLRSQLRSCQAGVRKARNENQDALSAAIAEARDADATLKRFAQQFEAKPKTCGAALAELDRVCESLAGY